MSEFVSAVSRITGLSEAMVRSPLRRLPLAAYRQAAMYLAYRSGYSSPQVGSAFGGRDHTTVLHAVRRAERGELAEQVRDVIAEATGQRWLL